jgi:hypothetical protein
MWSGFSSGIAVNRDRECRSVYGPVSVRERLDGLFEAFAHADRIRVPKKEFLQHMNPAVQELSDHCRHRIHIEVQGSAYSLRQYVT